MGWTWGALSTGEVLGIKGAGHKGTLGTGEVLGIKGAGHGGTGEVLVPGGR